jgi:hypothetical protein
MSEATELLSKIGIEPIDTLPLPRIEADQIVLLSLTQGYDKGW